MCRIYAIGPGPRGSVAWGVTCSWCLRMGYVKLLGSETYNVPVVAMLGDK